MLQIVVIHQYTIS